jgi:predicted Rossmann fold nucleotide-binding protein DprA/Smf involved in DNA uptake
MVGFFASRQCPGFAIRAAMDWALQKAQAKQVVVSGFHSPLERSVFTVLKAARSPVVAVVARPIRAAKLPTEWAAPLAQGHMAAVSQATAARRLTSEEAAQRNDLVAQLASQIVVAYANPNGSLTKQVAQWRATGRIVNVLVQD